MGNEISGSGGVLSGDGILPTVELRTPTGGQTPEPKPQPQPTPEEIAAQQAEDTARVVKAGGPYPR